MDQEPANRTAGNGSLRAPPLNGTADDDELYQVPVEIIVLLSFCYGLISLVTVVGNSMVLWIVATSRRMQTVTNFFIANLAVADIIIGLFSIPFQFQAALLQRWVLPEFMCAFCPFVQVLSVNVSIFTLTAIALDRYRAVTAPLRARCCSKFNAKVLIGIVWAVSTAAALPYALALRVILVYDSVSGEVSRPFCINEVLPPFAWKVYNHVLVGLQYFLPLCVICYTYGRIGGALRNSRTPGNAETVRDTNIIRNKRKVTKMILVVVAIFAICWLPYQTYNILQDLYPVINQYRYINVIWFGSHWLAMSNSCYNPFIYAIYSEKFSAEFRARMRCCSSRSKKEETHYRQTNTSMSTRYSMRSYS
ncbi:tachykinin-like peptides receptor 99D [Haemaphysalis longicornis]